MEHNKKPSEVISEFLGYLEFCKCEYQSGKDRYENIDAETYHWCHKFENAKNRNERNRIATAFQNTRKERRTYKDKAKLYERLAQFARDKSNDLFLKKLRKILADQVKTEEWLESDRAGEYSDNNP